MLEGPTEFEKRLCEERTADLAIYMNRLRTIP